MYQERREKTGCVIDNNKTNGVIHRNFKDGMFRDLFSDKRYALSLINALNNTNYKNPDELEVVTLTDVIYITKKNDFAVCIRGSMSIIEQNSTINPNMPLRGFIYAAQEFDKWAKAQGLSKLIYGTRLVKIPQPRYYVLYNGRDDAPPYEELKLSDAFINPSPGYEWTAHVYNIRPGKNDELLNKCEALKGYSTFVENVYNNYEDGMSMEDAVAKSADDCIKEGLIPEYLTMRRGELMQMTLGEIPLEEMKEVWYGEGFEEGEAKGLAKGIEQGIAQGFSEGQTNEKHANIVAFLMRIPNIKMASEIYGIGVEDICKIIKENGINIK